MFPAFADTTAYPDGVITLYFSTAADYIDSDDTDVTFLSSAQRVLALYQLSAHLLELGNMAAQGVDVGPIEESKVDKVQVKLAQRPASTMWEWWLSSTPYGKMLLALLNVAVAGGAYFGGSCEQSAFRKAGGVW